MTPEGAVKKRLQDYLISIGCCPASKAAQVTVHTVCPTGWFFMPVPTGFGVAGILDFIGQYKGRFFAIEAKAPGRRGEERQGLTKHQEDQMFVLEISGAFAIPFDGEEDCWTTLKEWVKGVDDA